MSKKKTHKSPSERAPGTTAGRLSASKKRVFYLLLLIFPLLLLLLLETGLRIGNYGNDYPLFLPFEKDPRFYKINPEIGKRYFPSTGIKPLASKTDFLLVEKPAQSYRIFVVGGSSAAGYPYLFNGSIANILKKKLAKHYPDKFLEVINLAMPAVSTYTVRDIALELDAHQPDMIVLYAGHNEFYGGLGVGSSEGIANFPWLVHMYLGLREYKTFQLVRNGIAGFKNMLRSSNGGNAPRGSLMAQLARERSIPYNSALFHAAEEMYRRNISDIAVFCEEQAIPLIAGTLVSNIRDQVPFVDSFADGNQNENWRDTYKAAEENYKNNNFSEALKQIEDCNRLDSLPASQYFLQGRIYERLGNAAAARSAYYRAKEFDGLRFRASEVLNQQIEILAEQGRLVRVPLKNIFEKHSPDSLPGNNLFLEHLHPTLAGYHLMAKSIGDMIVRGNYIGTPQVADVPDSLWIHDIGVTAVDSIVADIRIKYLTSGWPFKQQMPVYKSDFKLPGGGYLQDLAFKFWNDDITWEKMHVDAGLFYENNKQFDLAAREFKALITATPMNTSPYIYLGRMLIRQQKLDEALEIYQQAIQFEENALIYKRIGQIHLNRGNAIGVEYLEKSLQLHSSDPETLILLAKGYLLKEDLARAENAIKKALQIKPDLQEAQQLSQYINARREN